MVFTLLAGTRLATMLHALKEGIAPMKLLILVSVVFSLAACSRPNENSSQGQVQVQAAASKPQTSTEVNPSTNDAATNESRPQPQQQSAIGPHLKAVNATS